MRGLLAVSRVFPDDDRWGLGHVRGMAPVSRVSRVPPAVSRVRVSRLDVAVHGLALGDRRTEVEARPDDPEHQEGSGDGADDNAREGPGAEVRARASGISSGGLSREEMGWQFRDGSGRSSFSSYWSHCRDAVCVWFQDFKLSKTEHRLIEMGGARGDKHI